MNLDSPRVMPALNPCARCGAELRPQNSEGLCTRCLLESGLDESMEEPKVPGPGQTAFPPEIEDRKSKIENRTVRYFGDYELLEEIGRGGMGVVYRARQVSLNRFVAVKMLLHGEFSDEAFVRRFQIEAEAAAQLDHPHIVPIHEIGEHEGQHYFSMKLIDGGSLAQKIASGEFRTTIETTNQIEGKFDIRHSALLISKVARAVHYAHQRGVRMPIEPLN